MYLNTLNEHGHMQKIDNSTRIVVVVSEIEHYIR